MVEMFEKIIERFINKIDKFGSCDTHYAEGLRDAYSDAILITKQVENEVLEKEFSEWCHDCPAYDKENHHCPRWCKVIRTTVEEIKEGYNREWIPCSEELPDKYCHYLVTRRNDYEDGGYDSDVREDTWIELEGVWGWQSQFEGLIDNIIAWQPLPEPYQPKGGQK